MGNLVGFILVFLLTAGDVPPPHVAERSDDAYVLAIEHFDPQHEHGIEFGSPEHSFVRCALEATIELLPELEAVHIYMYKMDTGEFEATPLNSITLLASPSESQWLRDTAEMIGAGAYQTIIERRTGYKAEKVQRTKTIWRLGSLDENVENYNVEWLVGRGFKTMVLEELPESGFATLFLESRPADISRKLQQLHADPHYIEVFGVRQFKKFGEPRQPAGQTDIQVKSEAANRSIEEPLVLEFTCEWGDRPRVVTKSHTWTVRCQPLERLNRTRWRFEATLLSQQGDEVPANLWIKMGCGRQIGY